MFTGLVQAVGIVVQSRRTTAGLRLLIDPAGWDHQPERGDSISVNGVCLTVAALGGRSGNRGSGSIGWAFDAVPETLDKTTLGSLKRGDRVNLEHAATASTLLGGHLVQGHVDGVGHIRRVRRGTDWRVEIDFPEAGSAGADAGVRFEECIVPKGSVTVDGVSLTVAGLTRHGFEVALIPTTLAQTTLKTLKRGQTVNLEADLIAKTVVSWVQRFRSKMAPEAAAQIKPRSSRRTNAEVRTRSRRR